VTKSPVVVKKNLTIGVGDERGQAGHVPPPQKKIREKIFLGNYYM